MECNKVHRLDAAGDLPVRFNCPFCYTPHTLCVQAAERLQAYIDSRTDWSHELRKGKMFGVLIVKDTEGNIGFLAAFSGILAGRNRHDYFVPPVYDVQTPEGYFCHEERNISDINHKIDELTGARDYACALKALEETTLRVDAELSALRGQMREDKLRRDRLRTDGCADLDTLIRESQFQKAEFRRRKQALQSVVGARRAVVRSFEKVIEDLKEERKRRSAALQTWLFSQFRMLNARGETRDLNDIFRDTPAGMPPAGAGECAAPKLLQYAYLHGLTPVSMAEFWWGDSPVTEIRHHGSFYPSCLGKCGPILGHMLQGLDVEPNPLEERRQGLEARIIYEDDAVIVVDKPSGLLSVPGKHVLDSVATRMRNHCGGITTPMVVHRLDQDTSGLLVLAKTKEAHQKLQDQFHHRSVDKTYLALLDGDVATDEGTISLPVRPDPLDRPRQVVDFEHGKPSVTRFHVLRRVSNRTLIEFHPLTGRTHQLRVHAAHAQGLDTPICGDPIYGNPHSAPRLCLHAATLSFTHPLSGQRLTFSSPIVFNEL